MTPAAASTSAAPAPVRPLAGTDTAMVSAELAVSALAGVQRTPRVAFDGTNFLVVWSGDTPGLATDIYGAIVGQDGTIVVPSFAITAVVRDQLVPDVAFDGSNYLVVWQDARTGFGNDVYGAFVGTDGTVRQTNGFPISSAVNAQETPRVAFDGTSGRYLVVWSDARSGISFDVYGNRIDDEPIMVQLLDGNATAGGLVLSAGANAELTPAVAAGPGLFLVAWTDFRDEQDIYGTRVGALTAGASAVLDPAGRAFATAAGAQNLGDVAHDGVARQFIATWADQRGGSSLDAYGARIDETGALRDGPAGSGGILISTFAGSSASGLDIAVNAGFYLPVWASSENAGDIVAARVLADGTVVDNPRLAVTTTPARSEDVPAAAAGGGGIFVVYVAGAPARVHGRFVRPLAAGVACSSEHDCLSGQCVDGVCCNTACGGGDGNDCQACSVAAGAAVDGTCAALDGNTCSDGDLCTQTDSCVAGACVGANPVTCPAPAQCQAATCDSATGACSAAPVADGVSCDDGDACTGSDTCQGGVCQPGGPPNEVCDGIDNDCDTQTDEGFGLGDPCTVGVGECTASGTIVCDGSGGSQCSAAPGAPQPEICDSNDNDCDGSSDEGNPGGGSSCPTGGNGVCATGVRECQGGALACQAPAPQTERCDGVDSDCDGVGDSNDASACAHVTSLDGSAVACHPARAPSERCCGNIRSVTITVPEFHCPFGYGCGYFWLPYIRWRQTWFGLWWPEVYWAPTRLCFCWFWEGCGFRNRSYTVLQYGCTGG